LGELKGLHYDIEKRIKSRPLQEVSKAREKILAIAQKLGGTVEDLLDVIKKPKLGRLKRGGAIQESWRQFENVVRAWGGQPRWMVEGLRRGRKLDDFRI